MLILLWILGLKSQPIDFSNSFAQLDIPKVNYVYIELPTHFTCVRVKYVLLKIKNIKSDPCLFISNKVICVVYDDVFLFWCRSQSDIDEVLKLFE